MSSRTDVHHEIMMDTNSYVVTRPDRRIFRSRFTSAAIRFIRFDRAPIDTRNPVWESRSSMYPIRSDTLACISWNLHPRGWRVGDVKMARGGFDALRPSAEIICGLRSRVPSSTLKLTIIIANRQSSDSLRVPFPRAPLEIQSPLE